MKDAFNDIVVSLTRGADEREVLSRLDQLLDRYGSLGAYGRSDQVSFRFLTDELGELRAYGLILPMLFLGIVAFLLNLLLSRLVGTQRGQVAVLKAFGYTKFEIGVHYLELALVAAAAGAAAGVGFGMWLASGMMNIYVRYFHFPALQLQIDGPLILFAVAIAAGAACLGAISGARRAVALPPAEAMRPEPPATFRPGLLERIGVRTLLAPASRMIMRNLNRRRWRALLSALAVALSVAIVVAGRYSIDAINRLVSVQFHTVQREDVTLVFQEPRPARARHELSRLRAFFASNPIAKFPRASGWGIVYVG
jgi:putative ABC transport system permease protein